jgi:hypothetical protein
LLVLVVVVVVVVVGVDVVGVDVVVLLALNVLPLVVVACVEEDVVKVLASVALRVQDMLRYVYYGPLLRIVNKSPFYLFLRTNHYLGQLIFQFFIYDKLGLTLSLRNDDTMSMFFRLSSSNYTRKAIL